MPDRTQIAPAWLPNSWGFEWHHNRDAGIGAVVKVNEFGNPPALCFGAQLFLLVDGRAVAVVWRDLTFRDLTSAREEAERRMQHLLQAMVTA